MTAPAEACSGVHCAAAAAGGGGACRRLLDPALPRCPR